MPGQGYILTHGAGARLDNQLLRSDLLVILLIHSSECRHSSLQPSGSHILYAMGNDGLDCNYTSWGMDNCDGGKDGEINLGFHNRQATAKNIISVGASENFRPDLTTSYANGCNNHPDDGGVCPLPLAAEKFGTFPISIDGRSDNPEGMAAFSNRGPTKDLRIKPDIVAPGTNIMSTAVEDVGVSYHFQSGTSMATPITAGSAAPIVEHLNNIGAYNCNLVSSFQMIMPRFCPCKGDIDCGAMIWRPIHDRWRWGKRGNRKAPNNHEGWGGWILKHQSAQHSQEELR